MSPCRSRGTRDPTAGLCAMRGWAVKKVVAEIVRRAWWLRAANFAKPDYVRRDMV